MGQGKGEPMITAVEQLAKLIIAKLKRLMSPAPAATVVRALLQIAYVTSLRREEGRFVRGVSLSPTRPVLILLRLSRVAPITHASPDLANKFRSRSTM
ncbi:hypothetical protein [Nannocystis pusilla]|uniref:hypothetical protein n=1 Tax=Nannocystis pusilla TaxID=889268 RepID=UPI003B783995